MAKTKIDTSDWTEKEIAQCFAVRKPNGKLVYLYTDDTKSYGAPKDTIQPDKIWDDEQGDFTKEKHYGQDYIKSKNDDIYAIKQHNGTYIVIDKRRNTLINDDIGEAQNIDEAIDMMNNQLKKSTKDVQKEASIQSSKTNGEEDRVAKVEDKKEEILESIKNAKNQKELLELRKQGENITGEPGTNNWDDEFAKKFDEAYQKKEREMVENSEKTIQPDKVWDDEVLKNKSDYELARPNETKLNELLDNGIIYEEDVNEMALKYVDVDTLKDAMRVLDYDIEKYTDKDSIFNDGSLDDSDLDRIGREVLAGMPDDDIGDLMRVNGIDDYLEDEEENYNIPEKISDEKITISDKQLHITIDDNDIMEPSEFLKTSDTKDYDYENYVFGLYEMGEISPTQRDMLLEEWKKYQKKHSAKEVIRPDIEYED